MSLKPVGAWPTRTSNVAAARAEAAGTVERRGERELPRAERGRDPARAGRTAGRSRDRVVSARAAPPFVGHGAPSSLPEVDAVIGADFGAAMPPEFSELVIRGGGDAALSRRLWTSGITAEGAVDALTLAMRSPKLEDFGPARVLVEILGWARAAGGVDAARVQAGFRALKDGVVVGPDGMWVRARDGEVLQANEVKMVGGQAFAGGLPLGGLYGADQGVLFRVDPTGARGRTVGELALGQDPASAVLTGVSKFLMETLFGLGELAYGLVHTPEATLTAMVHSFGQIPKQAVALAFASPEMARRFARLPTEDKLRIGGQLLGSVLLAGAAARGAGLAGRSGGGPGLSRLRLRIGLADLGAGRTVPWLEVEGLAGLAPAGVATGAAGAGISQSILRSRDGDVAEPKVRFANEHHIGRTLGDPRTRGETIEGLADKLRAAVDEHPNTQKVYVRMAREYLEQFGRVPLDDVGRVHRALRDLPPSARVDLDAWVHRRFRQEIARIPDAATEAARAQATKIRRAADEAGLDLHTVYRPRLEAPPLESLTTEARGALRDILDGAREVEVSSRRVAEEVLSQYPELAQTQSWPKWKTKALLPKDFENTFHWDDVMGADGRVVGHGPGNPHGHKPHVQFRPAEFGADVHVFFPVGNPTR